MANRVGAAGRSGDPEQVATDALAREAKSPTGLQNGIAIPHCRTSGVSEPTLAFARLEPKVDFGAKDGPADLVFLITAPDGGGDAHLAILAKLAQSLVRSEFTDSLRAATTEDEVVDLVLTAVGDREPATAAAPAAPRRLPLLPPPLPLRPPPRATARVGSSPSPPARPASRTPTWPPSPSSRPPPRAGVEISVETQGSAGSKPLSPETIAAADAVIFAVDVGVRERGRFAGKPLVSSGVKRPIDDGDAMIAEALRYATDPNPPRVEGDASAVGTSSSGGGNESWGARIRRVLMTGVSYMIPFVAAGGLLIALGFLLAGYEIALPGFDAAAIATDNSLFNLPDASTLGLDHALLGSDLLAYLGILMFVLGGAAFGFLVPALAGYIAFAIADRPGIAPGFVMGAIAGTTSSGFIGGIVGGVLAGVIAALDRRLAGARLVTRPDAGAGDPAADHAARRVRDGRRPGPPAQGADRRPLRRPQQPHRQLRHPARRDPRPDDGLRHGRTAQQDGVRLRHHRSRRRSHLDRRARAADHGRRHARRHGAADRAGAGHRRAPGLFTIPERENGKAGWLLGASFITEGAIPFAAGDPLRVIPAIMLGSAVTGGLSQAFDVQLRAPHGGIFVLFAVDGVVGFVIALVAGVLVAAAAVIALKSVGDREVQPV